MRVFAIGLSLLLAACGSPSHPPLANVDSDGGGKLTTPSYDAAVSPDGGSATSDVVVLIPANPKAGTADFYIDAYEASLQGGRAVSVAGVAPAVLVDYAGAKQACLAGGKRLCTYAEWKVACRGPKDLLFSFQADAQNLASVCDVARTTNNTPGSLPSKTGAHAACKTDGYDVFDMIGNLTEWADSDTPVAAGVAFYQPAEASTCDATLNRPGTTTPMPPTEKATDIGFRCCRSK